MEAAATSAAPYRMAPGNHRHQPKHEGWHHRGRQHRWSNFRCTTEPRSDKDRRGEVVATIWRRTRSTMTTVVIHKLTSNPDNGSVIGLRTDVHFAWIIDTHVTGETQEAIVHVPIASNVRSTICTQPFLNRGDVRAALEGQAGSLKYTSTGRALSNQYLGHDRGCCQLSLGSDCQ